MTTKLSLKQLEKLSQEELLAIAQNVIDLKKAKKASKLEDYLKTMHKGQEAFHKDKHRIRFIFAGNRGGKTTGGTVEHLWAVLGTHPFQKYRLPLKSAIVVPDFENHAKNILEPKFQEWMPPNSIRKLDRHQNGAMKKFVWNSGSTTDVFSWDQDPMTFEGSDYDLVWFDEPPPHKIWKAMWRSCVDRGGRMYMTGTPLNCPWLYQVYQEIKDNQDPVKWFIKFDSTMNAKNIGEGDEALGKKRLEEWAAEYDEQERASRLGGDFMQLQGLVFKGWDRKKHLITPFPIPHNWTIIESIDPHPNKPWAVTWVALAPNGAKILLQAMYCEGVIDQVADQIILSRTELDIKDNLKPRITRCLIDNAASVPLWSKSNTDPTARRLSVREELENMIGPRGAGGPPVEVCPKNVQQKIDFLKSWLHVRERNGVNRADFYVFDNGKTDDFCFEIENYVWDRFRSRDREGFKTQPVKKDDDLLDSVMQIALTIGKTSIEHPESYDLIGNLESWGGSSSGTGQRRSLVKREIDFA